MPWEGGGGITPAVPKNGKAGAVTTKAPAVAGKVAPKPKPQAPPPPSAEGLSEEELRQLAVDGLTSVLESSPEGVGVLMARTGVFKAIKAAADEDTASAVITAHFGSDEAIADVASSLGYSVKNKKVVPE